MLRGYRNFLRGIAANWVGKSGVALTTSSFVVLVLFEGLSLLGVLRNAYLGLLTYLTLPGLFVLGLMLIPIGWWLHMRDTGRTTRELLEERFDPDDLEHRFLGSRLFAVVAVLTVGNLVFLGGASTQMVHFMDQPSFCGTACHVMAPEWAAYQSSAHARVDCVACHVGEGAVALLESKLSGLRQTLHFTFGTYARPIPTPVHQLRPAQETCQTCHWAGKPHGRPLVQRLRHDFDRDSTPRFTTLSLKLGSAAGERGSIHWHASRDSRIRYASVDDARLDMIWVESMQPDGSWRRFTNRGLRDGVRNATDEREMDCIDCHNRVAHVYDTPERAIDSLLVSGELSRELPFIKQRAFAAVTQSWADPLEARRGIERSIGRYYATQFPQVSIGSTDEIERAVEALQDLWRRNVHPSMRVSWDSYPDHMGHPGPNRGCFRCHDRDLVDERGAAIEHGCTLCHSILAEESPSPFYFLNGEVGPADVARAAWLRSEFLASSRPAPE